MQLGRYQVSTLRPPPILSIDFSLDGRFFAVALETGYEVWRAYPLSLLRRRSLPGTLARAVLLPNSPLLALQGGGKSPLYSPNKVILYHDGLGVAVAELEFGERVCGISRRASTLCVALSRRVIAFSYGMIGNQSEDTSGKGEGRAPKFSVTKIGEWETITNERGLMAISSAPGSTLLAIPGRQAGHVQLINLTPCRVPGHTLPARSDGGASQAFRSPIILAHEHPLSSLSCTSTGSHIVTTSERGTLLRVWSTYQGRLERELRRGVDRAEMWGTQFEDTVFGSKGEGTSADEKRRNELRGKGGRMVGWSDKGTVHVWGHVEDDHKPDASKGSSGPSLTHLLSRNLPLPKYFTSYPSSALYRLPRKNPHAFASTVSAAAEAAYLPSMKMREAGEEDGEWNERFVVGWVEVAVEVEDEDEIQRAKSGDKFRPGTDRKRSSIGSMSGGIGLGTREERRSFGSEATSTRATTPALGRNTPTPVVIPTPLRAQSNLSTSSKTPSRPPERQPTGDRVSRGSVKAVPKTGEAKRTKMERQLIAITFGGDWYRLRIPDKAIVADEDEGPSASSQKSSSGRKCELIEYRRLNVGGGGW